MTCRTLLSLVFALLLVSSLHAQQTRFDQNDRQRGNSFPQYGSIWQGNDWLGGSQQQPEWQLGVVGESSDVGIMVRQVNRNSAASRARIEVGDVIVCVEGYQVGLVDGRLYDLTEELNRRADERGTVSLVVQDHRTGRLANVRTQLDSNGQTLKGTLIYRDRNPIPSDAVVHVQIRNVTRPHYQVRHGDVGFRATPGDMSFEIAYDPRYIDAQDTYEVRAYVTIGGYTILQSRTSQPVLTRGNPSSNIQLQLVASSNGSPFGSAGFRPGEVANNGGGGQITGYPNYEQVDLKIRELYRYYLRRDPSNLELAALRMTPGIENRIDSMPRELMAAQEYFDLVGNNNQRWFTSVFREIVKREPDAQEFQRWMERYASLRYSRSELLRQLYSQVR